MGFELPNGKTARNIQEQVKFLTEKLKDLYSRVNDLEIHIEVVDELPETGVEGTIYLLPASDPEEGNYYEEYIWLDDAWELIGTTQVDLSQYYTKTETDAKIEALKSIIPLKDYGTIDGDTSQEIIDEINLKGGVFKIGNFTVFKLPNTSRTGSLSTLAIKVATVGQGGSISVGIGSFNASHNDFALNRTIWTGVVHSSANDLIATQNIRVNGNITDGTNSVTVSDIFNGTLNVINASDIVNNTFTQAQLDLIGNGKLTRIAGDITISFYVFHDLILGRSVSFGSVKRGFYEGIFGTSSQYVSGMYEINASGTISLVADSTKLIRLRNISHFNGIVFPDYPSSPATPQYLTYGTNNQLSWTGGASGTVLYQHKLVDSNNTNFAIYIINNSSTPITTLTTELINDALAAYFDYSTLSISYKKIATAATEYGIIFLYYYNGTRPVAMTEVSSLNESATVTDTVTQL